ncbi:MAG: TIGR03089 family protein [Sciscionella sp.]
MSVTEELFLPVLRSAPARPLITFYDDAEGSRIELSAATMANWAAKTANWLTEEIELEPGAGVAVLLPAHWQTLAVLLGAWWCGATVLAEPDDCAVAFVTEAAAGDGAESTAVLSLDPMGRGLRTAPEGGAYDFVEESRSYGDDFRPLQPISAESLALRGCSVEQTVATARRRAGELGFTARSRILSTMEWRLDGSAVEGLTDGLLAVLASGASLVQSAHTDPARLAGRASTERTTHTLS